LDPWLESWWLQALALYPLPAGLECVPDSVLPLNNFEITIDIEMKEKRKFHNVAKVIQNRRITSMEHFQDVRHFEFENVHEYKAGDILVISPQNNPEKVQKVLEYFEWVEMADKPIQFQANPSVTGMNSFLMQGFCYPPGLKIQSHFASCLNIILISLDVPEGIFFNCYLSLLSILSMLKS
jgi:hypothetical protein